jgi:hypothetical protein
MRAKVQGAGPAVAPRRWRRWVVGTFVAGLAVVASAFGWAYLRHTTFLRSAFAEADRLDPGWRLDDLEVARANFPDAENGALAVAALGALRARRAPDPRGRPVGMGLANAVTRTGEDVPDYDRATEREAAGGRVIELSPADWKSLAA